MYRVESIIYNFKSIIITYFFGTSEGDIIYDDNKGEIKMYLNESINFISYLENIAERSCHIFIICNT